MPPRVAILLAACALVTPGLAAPAALAPADAEFFESRIRPVLAQDCYECHRTGGKMKAGLALDHRAALLKGGDTGPAIIPGDPKQSLLLQAIRHEHDDLAMPKAGAKLDAAVIADFERWVARGAPDPRDAPPTEAQVAADTDWPAVMARRKAWWSFQPIRQVAPPPGPATHPVDRFLDAKITTAGLAAAPRADAAALHRRLSFALTGLPPDVADLTTELSPAPFTARVDALLASPRFGERWARHWMDWVRYADSHGSEGDPLIPNAWRYRDYLIRALNADVPYDQLILEHLAGDRLPQPRLNAALGLNESALGVAQLRMVLHGFAPTDALEELVRFTDDQINTVSKAFLALTLSCARCHDHKFDPLSQRDFTAWHGIFSSTAPAQLAVDAPDPAEPALRASLRQTKSQLRAALAEAWLADADALPARLTTPDAALNKSIAAAKSAESALHPFYLLAQGATPAAALEPWRNQLDGIARHHGRTFPYRWDLSRVDDTSSWRRDGPRMGTASAAGDFAVAAEGDRVVVGVYPAGLYSHLDSTKDRGLLLSPRVHLAEKYDLWLRLAGEGGAFARYVVQNYPRDGTVYPVQKIAGIGPRWIKQPLGYWQGDQIHIEFSTASDQPVLANPAATRSWIGVSEVLLVRAGELGPFEAWPFAAPLLAACGEPTTTDDLAAGFAAALRLSVRVWREERATDGDAELLDQFLRAGLLRNQPAQLPAVAPVLAAWRAQETALRIPTRAPGVIETFAADAPLFARGDHRQPGELVPRRFLEAIDATPYQVTDSGRLALARDLVRPDNPLTARVIVNRVWHHLFGRGLVATPDNFGRMGETPSHPELLDWLATWFVEHRWSIKALVRLLVTSDAWQHASSPPPGALERDPDNRLLSHASVRRLEAEAIRDALLAVSGALQINEMFGPPVLGATPRRSVYLRVKRNDLDPFLTAFDAPVPAAPTGRRDVTNVPAQSLALLNDPFVRQLAEQWAARLAADPTLAAPTDRIRVLYTGAFARPPTAEELARALAFLRDAEHSRASAAPWADLAHALFNAKEFIFLP
ncbi:MAG: PSD1 and planctomycete cytochrome C domain-containing protein [Opitutaceae bacterium]|nr:PSD1 and planctomycete cytochrome C domain-containing protein [Opitutaceae bacterium]